AGSDSLQKQIDAEKIKRAADQAQLDQIQTARQNLLNQGAQGGVLGIVNAALSGGQQDLKQQAEKLQKSIADSTAKIDAWNSAINSNIIKADQRGKQLVEEANLVNQTSDAAKNRLHALKTEQAGLEASIDALIESGDASEIAKEKLNQYND